MKIKRIGLMVSAGIFICTQLFAGTLEDIEKKVEKLEKENNALKERLVEAEEKIEITAGVIERNSEKGDEGKNNSGLFASSTVGGYGELHYNHLDGEGGAPDKRELDFHRFVLFFGHEFTDRIRFFSEIELEHAISGEGQVGEVELEQAYIDFDMTENVTARGGLFLIPVGILNETHEPPTFYGVERNPVEKNIIPATWWEGGFGVFGEIVEGLGYDLYLHSGLKTSAADGFDIRKGRQKAGKASAEDLAVTSRVRWTGISGLELSLAYQKQMDIAQSSETDAGGASLIETHAIFTKGPATLKALYARWAIDGSGPELTGADVQEGFYVEPSYKLTSQIGLFCRYNQWDNQAGGGSDSGKKQWDLGANYWPHENVVIKADFQFQDNENGKEQEGLNLGIGYQF